MPRRAPRRDDPALGTPLGDLYRALARLRPTDAATGDAIARLLRLERAEPAAMPAAATREPPPVAPPSPAAPPPESVRRPPPPTPAEVPTSADPVSFTLRPARQAARRLPESLERAAPLDEPPPQPPPAPLPDPLLLPAWTRAIVSGALAAIDDDGPFDVDGAVRAIATATPLLALPRACEAVMPRGVQLLVDTGDTMLPFAADQEWLVARIRAVVGAQRATVLRFAACPTWGAGPGPRPRWAPYFERHVPPEGTTVVALTDLGIGAAPPGAPAADEDDWAAFAERLRAAGSSLVAFVPYDERRWPPALGRQMAILHWDRATSVRAVRRAVGAGLRARGRTL